MNQESSLTQCLKCEDNVVIVCGHDKYYIGDEEVFLEDPRRREACWRDHCPCQGSGTEIAAFEAERGDISARYFLDLDGARCAKGPTSATTVKRR